MFLIRPFWTPLLPFWSVYAQYSAGDCLFCIPFSKMLHFLLFRIRTVFLPACHFFSMPFQLSSLGQEFQHLFIYLFLFLLSVILICLFFFFSFTVELMMSSELDVSLFHYPIISRTITNFIWIGIFFCFWDCILIFIL